VYRIQKVVPSKKLLLFNSNYQIKELIMNTKIQYNSVSVSSKFVNINDLRKERNLCKIIFIIFLSQVILMNSSIAQDCYWSSHVGGSKSDAMGIIGIDMVGNVYTAGSTESPMCYFSNDTLQLSGAFNQAFIVKYDSDGNELWIKKFTGQSISYEIGYISVGGIIDTVRNELFVFGNFYGHLVLSDTNLYGSGMTIFIMKIDLNGEMLWARTIGGEGYDEAFSIANDEQGNIYLSGINEKEVTLSNTIIDPGGFLAKYSYDGDLLWAKNKFRYYAQYPQSPSWPFTEAPPLRILYSKQKLLINGYVHNDTVVIDTITRYTEPGSTSSYIASFDTAGEIEWLNFAGGPEGSCGLQFDNDTSGNIFITGYFGKTGYFGNDTLTNSVAYNDGFIAKYRNDGNIDWVKQLNSSDLAHGTGVESDGSGGVNLSGIFSGIAQFGEDTLIAGSSSDMFLTYYNSEGICQGVRQYTYGHIGHFIVDHTGNIYLAGSFQNTLTIGPNTFTSYGDDDIFVAKCSAITSIEEKSMPQQTQLLIYANPTTGKCNIKIPEDFRHEKNLVLQIFDNNGKMIQNIPVIMDQEKISLNISAVARGMYNAILSNGKKSYSGKIVFE
jgi:hypothetical protein